MVKVTSPYRVVNVSLEDRELIRAVIDHLTKKSRREQPRGIPASRFTQAGVVSLALHEFAKKLKVRRKRAS